MKSLSTIVAIGIGASSFAADAWEKSINDALLPLRFTNSAVFQLQGNEWVGAARAPVQCNLFYSSTISGIQPVIKVELITYLNGRVADRIVGDGKTLWTYNCRTYEYSATAYGTYDGKVAANYQRDLMSMLYSAARGSASYPARLLKEVFSGQNVEYRNWLPGSVASEIVNSQAIADPIWPTRVYRPTPDQRVWLFAGSNRKSMAFTVNTGNPQWELTQIDFAESFKNGSKERASEWSMGIFRDADLTNANFTAYARDQIRGWRVIPSPKVGG